MSHASVSGTSAPAPWADPAPPSGPSSRSAGSLLRALIMPLVLAAFATYLLVGMLVMEVPDSVDFPGPRFFPAIITGVMYVLVAVQVITVVRHWSSGTLGDTDDAAPATFSWRSLIWVIGGFLAFSLLLEFLGWILGAALLFWCVTRAFGAPHPVFDILVALFVSSLAYLGFAVALGLTLPSGILGGGF